MKVHLEKINNRYKGPFEKQKNSFFINQIISNLLSIENENNLTNNDIKKLLNVNENEGFNEPNTSNIISDKEKLRDRISTIENESLNMLKELNNN